MPPSIEQRVARLEDALLGYVAAQKEALVQVVAQNERVCARAESVLRRRRDERDSPKAAQKSFTNARLTLNEFHRQNAQSIVELQQLSADVDTRQLNLLLLLKGMQQQQQQPFSSHTQHPNSTETRLSKLESFLCGQNSTGEEKRRHHQSHLTTHSQHNQKAKVKVKIQMPSVSTHFTDDAPWHNEDSSSEPRERQNFDDGFMRRSCFGQQPSEATSAYVFFVSPGLHVCLLVAHSRRKVC
jgi:hypothetical protein